VIAKVVAGVVPYGPEVPKVTLTFIFTRCIEELYLPEDDISVFRIHEHVVSCRRHLAAHVRKEQHQASGKASIALWDVEPVDWLVDLTSKASRHSLGEMALSFPLQKLGSH